VPSAVLAPSAPSAPPGAPRSRGWLLLLIGTLLALAACAVVLELTGAADTPSVPGLPAVDASSPWLLPLTRLIARLAQVALIGFALAAAALLPSEGRSLSPQAWQAIRRAAVAGGVWAAAQIVMVPLTAANLLGVAPWSLSMNRVISTLREVDTGRTLMLDIGFAIVCAALAAWTLRRSGAIAVLVVALIAVVPQAASGHASAAGDHQLAVSGLFLHLGGILIWSGGLLAVVLGARAMTSPMLAAAARRYSAIAGPAAAVAVLSGLLAAELRLGFLPSRWFTTDYGLVVLVKVAATVALLLLGLAHRRVTLRRLADGQRGAFVRLASGEALIFAFTLGVATALGRVAPPALGGPQTNAQTMLGFPMPPPITAGRVLLDWYPEPLFLGAAIAAVGAYLGGVIRLRRSGVRWPILRTLSWIGGWLIVAFAMGSGMARYAPVLVTMHMAQHLLLAMYAAPLLVLAAPVTLALRALKPAPDPALPGPREALLASIHSRYSKVVTNPVVALVFFAGGTFAVFFSGLYEASLRHHTLHILVSAEFLIAGYFFYYSVVGIDPSPSKAPAALRLVVLLISTVAHTVFGVALMSSSTALAPSWWEQLGRPWGPDPVSDTQSAGGLAWAFGEIPSVVIMLVFVVLWARTDEREQRRRDRAADIKGSAEADAFDAYNDMLHRLADRDGRAGAAPQRPPGGGRAADGPLGPEDDPGWRSS